MGRPKDGSLNILRWGVAGSKIYEKPAQCSSRDRIQISQRNPR